MEMLPYRRLILLKYLVLDGLELLEAVRPSHLAIECVATSLLVLSSNSLLLYVEHGDLRRAAT